MITCHGKMSKEFDKGGGVGNRQTVEKIGVSKNNASGNRSRQIHKFVERRRGLVTGERRKSY